MLSDIIDHKEMKQSTNIKLANYFENKNIAYQPFNYAGIDGNAEIVGWQIVMFRRAATDNKRRHRTSTAASIRQRIAAAGLPHHRK